MCNNGEIVVADVSSSYRVKNVNETGEGSLVWPRRTAGTAELRFASTPSLWYMLVDDKVNVIIIN